MCAVVDGWLDWLTLIYWPCHGLQDQCYHWSWIQRREKQESGKEGTRRAIDWWGNTSVGECLMSESHSHKVTAPTHPPPSGSEQPWRKMCSTFFIFLSRNVFNQLHPSVNKTQCGPPHSFTSVTQTTRQRGPIVLTHNTSLLNTLGLFTLKWGNSFFFDIGQLTQNCKLVSGWTNTSERGEYCIIYP